MQESRTQGLKKEQGAATIYDIIVRTKILALSILLYECYLLSVINANNGRKWQAITSIAVHIKNISMFANFIPRPGLYAKEEELDVSAYC